MQSSQIRIPTIAAALYSAWALLIYFFADHAWWPMFLYPIIWPLSWLFERVLKYPILDWVNPEPTSDAGYILFDRISGFFYIVGGALWIWMVCYIILKLVKRARTQPAES